MIQKAAEATTAITSGSLDYLIANACYIPKRSSLEPFSVLGQEPQSLTDELVDTFRTNAVGNVHLFNIFVPLVLNGAAKKIVTISTGMADLDLVTKYGVAEAGPYAISKAAMNMVAAKFQAEYEKDGILFISISPGLVDTGNIQNRGSLYSMLQGMKTDIMLVTEEENAKLMAQGAKFAKYAPHFRGPAQPEDAVRDVLKVVEDANLEGGYGGAFISHLGNKQWL
jgi:NAD(P)-dependent dehydrogenase (short-subunit alcohol dehydrogenase family)